MVPVFGYCPRRNNETQHINEKNKRMNGKDLYHRRFFYFGTERKGKAKKRKKEKEKKLVVGVVLLCWLLCCWLLCDWYIQDVNGQWADGRGENVFSCFRTVIHLIILLIIVYKVNNMIK